MKIFKRILIVLLIIIGVIALALVGGYCYLRFAKNVDAFRILSSFNTVGEKVDENKLVTNPYSSQDMVDAQSLIQGSTSESIITKNADGTYSIDFSKINPSQVSDFLSKDLCFSDTQMAAIADNLIEEKTGGTFEIISGVNVTIKLKQIAFSNITSNTADINMVVKANVSEFKKKYSFFPLNFLVDKLPDDFYLSSTFTMTHGSNAFSYTNTSKSITLNNLSYDDTSYLLNSINQFVSVGTADDLNVKLADLATGYLIGDESNPGFAYKLKSLNAKDYTFETKENKNYFVIKRSLI